MDLIIATSRSDIPNLNQNMTKLEIA